MARRYKALHHGNMDGKNVPFHREHRSKRGRKGVRVFGMRPQLGYYRNSWKQSAQHLFHTKRVILD